MRLSYRLWCYVIAAMWALTFFAAIAVSADSPTGHNPTLLWSSAQQDILNRMVAEKHWTINILKSQALNNAQPIAPFWAFQWYRVSGDAAARDRCFALLSQPNPRAPGIVPIFQQTKATIREDDVRQLLTELCIVYDTLAPSLTADQIKQFKTALTTWCELAANFNMPQIGTQKLPTGQVVPQYRNLAWDIADSDLTLGRYFGILACDKILGTNYKSLIPPTVEPAVRRYFALGQSGVWPEAGMYDQNTVPMAVMGASITPGWSDDLAKLLNPIADYAALTITPDREDCYQWGDEQEPHMLSLYKRLTFCSAVVAHDVANQLMADSPKNGSVAPWYRYFYWCNPYAPEIAPHPDKLYSPSTGMLLVKGGDHLFGSIMSPVRDIQHINDNPLSDADLWFNGEWVFNHPFGYALPRESNTCFLAAGLGRMTTRVNAQSFGDGYEVTTMIDGGPWYSKAPNPNKPPPVFVRNHTRTVVFLKPSTLVIYDSVDMDDPKPSLPLYSSFDQPAIKAAPYLRQAIFHARGTATRAGNVIGWATKAGQQCNLTLCVTDGVETRVGAENWPNWNGNGAQPGEADYTQIIVGSNTANRLVEVLSVGEAPACEWDSTQMVLTVGSWQISFAGSVTSVAKVQAQ